MRMAGFAAGKRPGMARATASTSSLVLERVDHAYAMRTVLEGVSFQLPAGQTVALVGPSGCGKSTLLHLCAGLTPLQHGHISNSFSRTVTLFQQPHLLPWKTTLDNIALGLKAQGVPRQERLAQSRQMAASLGLDQLSLGQFPHQLSGGMQSRVALARALVLSPDLLLLDEPFSALDIGLKAQMHQLLIGQQRQRQLSVLMITHDLAEAVTLADTVLVMATAPGRLVWRMDLPLPPAERDDGWVHRHAVALMSQRPVREAFGLPPLPATPSAPLPDGPLKAASHIDAGSPLSDQAPATARRTRC